MSDLDMKYEMLFELRMTVTWLRRRQPPAPSSSPSSPSSPPSYSKVVFPDKPPDYLEVINAFNGNVLKETDLIIL